MLLIPEWFCQHWQELLRQEQGHRIGHSWDGWCWGVFLPLAGSRMPGGLLCLPAPPLSERKPLRVTPWTAAPHIKLSPITKIRIQRWEWLLPDSTLGWLEGDRWLYEVKGRQFRSRLRAAEHPISPSLKMMTKVVVGFLRRAVASPSSSITDQIFCLVVESFSCYLSASQKLMSNIMRFSGWAVREQVFCIFVNFKSGQEWVRCNMCMLEFAPVLK